MNPVKTPTSFRSKMPDFIPISGLWIFCTVTPGTTALRTFPSGLDLQGLVTTALFEFDFSLVQYTFTEPFSGWILGFS
jgi:hypothetical protein